ncbi:FixH family protein [Paenibacillus aestuarii]|uniref:FixH family protein n=1 Tax=Paenibacillus aestuarii TaxID=516965 RepID=A0ABW0KFH5_9BACL|nr:FixH family protein [Paenibacillus aestuarii]
MNKTIAGKLSILLLLTLALLYIWLHHWNRDAPTGAETTVADTDGYTVEVIMEKAPAQLLKPNPLTIRLHRADGQPVSTAKISYELFMPSMFCGTVSGEAAPATTPGSYQADAVPLMTGSWVADITVQVDGQRLQVKHPFAAIR